MRAEGHGFGFLDRRHRATCGLLVPTVIAAMGATVVRAQAPAESPGAPPRMLALTHVTLIDGTGAAPRPDVTVVIANGRVADVFPSGRRFPATGATVMDLTGRYVIPGLIDAHVHVSTDPAGRDRDAAGQLRGALLGGVTAVRDMAGDALVLVELAARGRIPEVASPRIYFSALMAGPAFFEDPRTRTAAHGMTPGDVPWMQAVSDTTDLSGGIARARATGATGIKVYADIDPELLGRIATEAHRQGLKVWSHATIFPAKPSDAVAAGVDVLSHAILLYWDGVSDVPAAYHHRAVRSVYDSVPVDRGELPDLFRRMRERGTVLDATLFISSKLETAPLGASGMADPRRAAQWMYDATRCAREAGVQVAAGTDGMMPGGEGELPNLHREMELLVTRAGFTPLEAILAATRNGARTIGAEGEIGTIEPGRIADLVILTADPVTDIRNSRKIDFVVKEGWVHRLASITATVGER